MNENFFPKQKHNKEINANILRDIALITMFIDHIGAAVVERGFPSYGILNLRVLDMILRYIGRISFPIFCFLLVEGFLHTHDIRKYLIRMAVFAIISELPFDLAMRGEIWLEHQNVFFTLFLGLFMMVLVQKAEQSDSKIKIPLILGICLVFAFLAQITKTDYGAVGIFLIFILYMTRTDRFKQCILGAICMAYEYTSVFAFLPIYFYNGKRKESVSKYFFYWFYPLHLLFLYGVHILIAG